MTESERASLNERARVIRGHIIRMLASSKSGHPGGSLSAVEIITTLYFRRMKIDPKNPKMPDRDRFVLSKGHAAPVLYAALAEAGYFSTDILPSLRQFGSILQGHPDMKKTPGIEISTGSLGQGLSAANGMALAAKLDKKDYRVYVLLGDGEIQEGQIWEAAMTSVHYKLDNLTAFLDYNHLQIDGSVESVKTGTIQPGPRFASFGWQVFEVDGHNVDAIDEAITKAQAVKDKPSIIICNTVKGKGVSFMENQVGWHGAAPKPEEAEKALGELGF